MLILLIFWGSFAAVSKLTIKNMDGFQLLFAQFAAAFAIMTIMYIINGDISVTGVQTCALPIFNGDIRKLSNLSVKQVVLTVLFALPSFLYYLFYFLSLKLIPAIEASILNYLFPVFIILFSIIIDREKMQMYKIGAILLGFAGVVVIITGGNLHSARPTNIQGDVLAICAAVSWGMFSVLGRRNPMDLQISNYLSVAISFLLSLVCVLLFSRFRAPDPPSLLGILWLSLSNIVLGYYLWFKVLKLTSAAMASSMSLITPFVTFLFIALLLNEKITGVQLAGLALVIAGLLLQNIPFFMHLREKFWT